jgi:hypothetical protein
MGISNEIPILGTNFFQSSIRSKTRPASAKHATYATQVKSITSIQHQQDLNFLKEEHRLFRTVNQFHQPSSVPEAEREEKQTNDENEIEAEKKMRCNSLNMNGKQMGQEQNQKPLSDLPPQSNNIGIANNPKHSSNIVFLDFQDENKLSEIKELKVSNQLDMEAVSQAMKEKVICHIYFHQIHYTEFIQQKSFLKPIIKQLSRGITLNQNSIENLQQIETLVKVFKEIKYLTITDNPVCISLKRILKPFCIFYFSKLEEFNGRTIQNQDRVNAEKIFKKRQIVLSTVEAHRQCSVKSISIAHKYVTSLINDAYDIDQKTKIIDVEWEKYLSKLTFETMTNYNSTRKLEEHLDSFILKL